jgi:hypothetical protein
VIRNCGKASLNAGDNISTFKPQYQ